MYKKLLHGRGIAHRIATMGFGPFKNENIQRRPGLILGAVALITIGSAFTFYYAGMRGRYKLK